MPTPPGADAATLPITALVPALDREELIQRAIASARAQSPAPPAQILVVDDGSSDRTAEVAAALGADVVRHERNKGLSAARNTGMREAANDWVALLDSDDEWLPNHLDLLWGSRGSHVLLADVALSIGSGSRRWHGPCSERPTVIDSPDQLLFPENFISASGTVFRRDIALEVGGYDEQLRKIEDLDLLVRILERGTGLAVPVVGTIYHGHEDQMSGDRSSMRDVHREVIEKYAGRPWWSPELLRAWDGGREWDEARLALRQGRRGDAGSHLLRIAASPGRARGVARMLAWRRRTRRMLSQAPAGI